MGSRKTSDKGELICFIQIGKSPIKHSIDEFIPPDKRFVIPEYRCREYLCQKAAVLARPTGPHPTERKERTVEFESPESYLLTDLEALAQKTLSERMGREIAREIARLAAKEEVSREIEEETSETTENLVRFGFILAESADTRSWQTLPEKLEVVKLFLDANNALVEETFLDEVRVKPGRKVFLLNRSLR